jgi:hypothetical protein
MIDITDEFREKVDKAAKSVAGRDNLIEWEDLSQDMWVWLLQNPNQYTQYTELDDPYRNLLKIARQEKYKQNSAREHFSGNYTYTSGEVRILLDEYLVDVTLERVSEHVDLVEGLLLLKEDTPTRFKVLIDKYVKNIEKDRKATTRAVDSLVQNMNQVNKAARYSYEGPGSRKVMTNTQSIARKDNSWN